MANEAGQFFIIDPGWDSREGRRRLVSGIAAAGFDRDDLLGVVATHYHADHLGLAAWLTAGTEAWIGVHARDSHVLSRWPDAATARLWDNAWLAESGVPPELFDALARPVETHERYRRLSSSVEVELADGDALALPGRDVRVVATPGHTPGHICLLDLDSEIVFTGDHVLPRISSNVGLHPISPAGDKPLSDYFSSLTIVAAFDAYQACPAHQYRFFGLGDRARELEEHQRRRCADIRRIVEVDPNRSAWEVATRARWSRPWERLDWQSRRSALAEVRAHLELLSGAS